MAKPNDSKVATSRDHQDDPESVRVNAAPAREGLVSRRTLMNMLATITATPALALSAPATAASVKDTNDELNNNYNAGCADARADFALAWLKQWTDAGGSVTIDPSDEEHAWFGRLTFSLSHDGAAFEAREAEFAQQAWWNSLSAEEQERLARDRGSYARACYDGKMRALEDILDAVPEVASAVRELVAVAPGLGLRSPEA